MLVDNRNNIVAVLEAGLIASATSVVIVDNDKVQMPDFSVPTQKPVYMTLEGIETISGVDVVTRREVVLLTNVNDNLLTVTRAVDFCVQDDSQTIKTYTNNALTFFPGDTISMRFVAKQVLDLNEEIKTLQDDIDDIINNPTSLGLMDLTTSQTVDPGIVKTFQEHPQQLVYVAPTLDNEYTPKKYVDDQIVIAGSPKVFVGQPVMVGEDLIEKQSVYEERYPLIQEEGQYINIGDVTANTRVSGMGFYSGEIGETLLFDIDKVSTPAVDLQLSIQGDNAGNPNGIDIATATISETQINKTVTVGAVALTTQIATFPAGIFIRAKKNAKVKTVNKIATSSVTFCALIESENATDVSQPEQVIEVVAYSGNVATFKNGYIEKGKTYKIVSFAGTFYSNTSVSQRYYNYDGLSVPLSSDSTIDIVGEAREGGVDFAGYQLWNTDNIVVSDMEFSFPSLSGTRGDKFHFVLSQVGDFVSNVIYYKVKTINKITKNRGLKLYDGSSRSASNIQLFTPLLSNKRNTLSYNSNISAGPYTQQTPDTTRRGFEFVVNATTPNSYLIVEGMPQTGNPLQVFLYDAETEVEIVNYAGLEIGTLIFPVESGKLYYLVAGSGVLNQVFDNTNILPQNNLDISITQTVTRSNLGVFTVGGTVRWNIKQFSVVGYEEVVDGFYENSLLCLTDTDYTETSNFSGLALQNYSAGTDGIIYKGGEINGFNFTKEKENISLNGIGSYDTSNSTSFVIGNSKNKETISLGETYSNNSFSGKLLNTKDFGLALQGGVASTTNFLTNGTSPYLGTYPLEIPYITYNKTTAGNESATLLDPKSKLNFYHLDGQQRKPFYSFSCSCKFYVASLTNITAIKFGFTNSNGATFIGCAIDVGLDAINVVYGQQLTNSVGNFTFNSGTPILLGEYNTISFHYVGQESKIVFNINGTNYEQTLLDPTSTGESVFSMNPGVFSQVTGPSSYHIKDFQYSLSL